MVKSLAQLLLRNQDVQIGALYRHYKGNVYEVVAVARHSENPVEKLVVYKALYDSLDFGKNSIWVRPYGMFTEKVAIDGVERFRFEKVEDALSDKNVRD